MAAIVLMSGFTIGEGFVVALAARQELPRELYELARVEGARRAAHVAARDAAADGADARAARDPRRRVQPPGHFVPAYLLTDGGPDRATLFLPLYAFDVGFEQLRYGYAAAMTLTMFVITGAARRRPALARPALALRRDELVTPRPGPGRDGDRAVDDGEAPRALLEERERREAAGGSGDERGGGVDRGGDAERAVERRGDVGLGAGRAHELGRGEQAGDPAAARQLQADRVGGAATSSAPGSAAVSSIAMRTGTARADLRAGRRCRAPAPRRSSRPAGRERLDRRDRLLDRPRAVGVEAQVDVGARPPRAPRRPGPRRRRRPTFTFTQPKPARGGLAPRRPRRPRGPSAPIIALTGTDARRAVGQQRGDRLALAAARRGPTARGRPRRAPGGGRRSRGSASSTPGAAELVRPREHRHGRRSSASRTRRSGTPS